MASLDVRPWNLGVPLALLAACGRTLIVPETGDTDVDPSGPTDPTTEPSTTTEYGSECRIDEDCPSGWYCSSGICYYGYDYCSDGDCCDDGCCYDGCWYYECYDDYSCGPGYECVNYYCEPLPPGPQQCESSAVEFGMPIPLVDYTEPVSLAFVGGPNGRELVVGDAAQLSTFGNGGTTLVAEVPASAIATGDLDADGDEDLLVADPNELLLRTYLRDPMLGFLPGPTVGVPGGVEQLLLVDLDGEGTLDAVVSTALDSTIMFNGLGMAVFGPPVELFAGDACGLTALASVTEPPLERLAFGLEGVSYLAFSPFEIEILPIDTDLTTSCVGASGDVDADGWTDYVMLERGAPRLDTWWSAEQLNYGVSWSMPFDATALAVGNLDGVAGDEVVTTTPDGPAMVRFPGPTFGPDGSYDPLGCYSLFDLGYAVDHVAVGDLDGDGREDLVGAAQGTVFLWPQF